VRLKFGGDERLGKRMGELMALPWALLSRGDDCSGPIIVPVPLHSSRRRERGYNQSELLALGLARKLKSIAAAATPRVLRDGLCRKRATPPQTGLTVAARRENVRGAFEVARAEQIHGRRIIVVDDVMTTGATVSACARALKRAGAAHVTAITLARATPQFPDLANDDRDNTVDGLGRDWT
jgi:ComF family protein